ncbi:MAG: hypothetical protein ABR549_13815 [Mycobacteriales bacterium]
MPGIRGLTTVERGVGGVAVGLLLAGIVGAGTFSPAHDSTSLPAVTTSVRTADPSPAAIPVPAPTTTVAKKRTVVDRPIAPAPPLSGCPVPHRSGGGGKPKPLPPPVVAEAALPAPVPVHGKAGDLTAVRGKGLWATPFGKAPLDVDGLISQARRAQVRSIWVRTGRTRQGYYGQQFLPRLITQAHAAGLFVIAWDFPFLSDPVADARRAEQALVAGVDGFSPDVETTAEGTRLTSRRLRLYLSLVRQAAGTRPVIATVPRPSSARRGYPYSAFPPYADVFAPMVYWSCREPGAVVQQSLAVLTKLLPVAPVGQGYDMGDEGGRRGTPSRQETLRFLDAARRAGAIGASLWTVEEAGPAQLRALADYRWSR